MCACELMLSFAPFRESLFLSYFFVKKKYLLVGGSGVCYHWVNGSMGQWKSEGFMYVTPIRLELL